MKNPKAFLRSITPGCTIVISIGVVAFFLSSLDFFKQNHLSILTIGIIIGACLSTLNGKNHVLRLRRYHSFKPGINLMAKKALRLGIMLYGFNVSLLELGQVGLKGILIACMIVAIIFLLGLFFGKLLGMDNELAMLVSIGNAVCGAAAILALEAMLKCKGQKVIIAVGTIIIFGIISMFAIPWIINLLRVPLGLDFTQIGVLLGASLQEVANVVVAGANIIAPDATTAAHVSSLAVIEKMIRVILLVPVLLIIGFVVKDKTAGAKIAIPYFALIFLCVILLNTALEAFIYPSFPAMAAITHYGSILSKTMLLFSMSALGLQIAFDKKIFKAFGLATILICCAVCVAFVAVKIAY